MKRLPALLTILAALTYGGFVASVVQQPPGNNPAHNPVALSQPPQEDHEAKAVGQERSPHWPKVRAACLVDHPECAVCGKTEGCEVHHEVPFHRDRTKELDPSNLITLCRDHHFLFGHLDSWKSWNADVRKDAAAWRKKLKERP